MADITKLPQSFHEWFGKSSDQIATLCNELRRDTPRSLCPNDPTINVRDNGYKDGWLDAVRSIENFLKSDEPEPARKVVPYQGNQKAEDL